MCFPEGEACYDGGVEIFLFVVALILFLNLRGRVQKLEQSIKKDAPKDASASSSLQPQVVVQSSPHLEPLLAYAKQQMAQGMDKEDIESSLVANGWNASDIEKGFSLLIAQVPAAPGQANPASSSRFLEWLKEDWLLKLGALFLLIGFGWLTSYAFLNNWIGPMGRIALGIIAGALFLMLGWWRIKKFVHQGGVFLVLGSTIILLTVFAAREIYQFFTPSSALAVMFLSTAFVALASVKYNSKSLSLASLVLAGIAPLLTSSPSPDYIGLFAYLFVVILGAIWIVALTGWRELTTAALLLISFYSLPHLFSPASADTGTLLLFAYAFAAVFFLTNTAGILKSQEKDIFPNLVTAAGNGLFLLAWIMAVAPDEWQSLIISAWMVVFSVGAFLIFKVTQRREPFYVYAGIGIAMLAAATSAELHGATLAIAYTIESAAIVLVAYSVLRDIKIAERASLLLIVPVVLSAESINSRAWDIGVIHEDFFVLLTLALTFLGLCLFFSIQTRGIKDTESEQFNGILLTLGSVYSYALLWLSLHAALESDNAATTISLIVYTIIGIITYFYGLTNEQKGFRLYGGVLIGFVVARLFLVDVWIMELGGKIVTFFLMGVLLMSTAFLRKKKQVSILPNQT